jgi:MFS family permease
VVLKLTEMSNHQENKVFYGWIIAFVSLAVTTTGFGIMYTFGVFFKLWLREWDCSRAFLSGVFSLCFLVYGISSFFMGRMTDRYGPRKTLALGGLIMGTGALLTSFASAPWILYLTFGLMIGIGVGTSYSPTASTVSRWFVKKKGTAVGIVVAGLGLGTLVYSPLARFLIGIWNWRSAFVLFGFMIWAVYLVAAYLIRRNPQDLGLQPYKQEPQQPIQEDAKGSQDRRSSVSAPQAIYTKVALGKSYFWILFFVHCLWVVGMAIPMVHLVPYATDIGVPPGTAAAMLAVLGGVSVLGRLVLGAVGENIGTRNSLRMMLLIQALAMLWLAASKGPWMLWMFSLLFGFSYGGLASMFPLVTSEYFGVFAMGSIFGLILLGATLGGVVGPWLAGFIFDLAGQYFYGFLAGMISMAMGLILTLYLPSGASFKKTGY